MTANQNTYKPLHLWLLWFFFGLCGAHRLATSHYRSGALMGALSVCAIACYVGGYILVFTNVVSHQQTHIVPPTSMLTGLALPVLGVFLQVITLIWWLIDIVFVRRQIDALKNTSP